MKCLLPFLAGGLLAAEPADTLDRLLLANRVRAELAREQASHTADMQRLAALRVTITAATEQATADAQAAEARASAARQQATPPPPALALHEAVEALEAALAPIAARLPPGTLPPSAPAGADSMARFDAAVLRLEAAERAAVTVAVHVVTGTRPDGTPLAVKLLRVGGTARWWLALDGQQAGQATRTATGDLILVPEPTLRPTITAAIAQAEGREPPGIVPLPVEVTP